MNLNNAISQVYSTNEKNKKGMCSCEKCKHTKLEEQIISLDKNQGKPEQWSRHNNSELSGLPTEIREDNLEKVVIAICHKLRLENQAKSKDI